MHLSGEKPLPLKPRLQLSEQWRIKPTVLTQTLMKDIDRQLRGIKMGNEAKQLPTWAQIEQWDRENQMESEKRILFHGSGESRTTYYDEERLPNKDLKVTMIVRPLIDPGPTEPPDVRNARLWLVIEKVLTDWIPGIAGSRLIEKIKEDVLNNIK